MQPDRKVPVHYLRGNETSWTPPQIITFDTETRTVTDPKGETHMMRLWAARLDSRRPDSAGWVGTDTAWGRTPGELAAQIGEWCRGQRCVWAFAHNLSFDLMVSRLPDMLGRLGWQVTDHAAGSESPWLRMANGQNMMTLADSWGWLRKGIGDVGELTGHVKPPLPSDADPEATWLARCEADRDILAGALLSIMKWWDECELGHWSLTGSTSGWNVMRHMMPRRKVTIIPDPEQVADDRAAIYGGRRECFRWGNVDGGPFVEYDFAAAYPTIAANLPLPSKRLFHFDRLDVDHPLTRGVGQGIIAQVEIETGRPRWPVRVGGRVWYPVGRFTTTLAGPEIAEAARLGCLRAVGPGWAHSLGWHMAEWAKWVISVQSGITPGVPPAAVPMVKHWGRAVVGKWAARGYAKQEYGDALSPGWSYLPIWDINRQAHGAIVEMGGRRWKCLQTEAGDNCYPAVLAYVEAHTRLRLTRALRMCLPGEAVCCDTDGLTVADRPGVAERLAGGDLWPLDLRRKAVYRAIKVIGPQHLIRDGKRKFSGVPGSAVPGPDGTLRALVWPRMAWQIREHAGPGYRRPEQVYTVAGSYASGWVTASGAVVPVELVTGPDGGNIPGPPPDAVYGPPERRLGPVQSPAVARIFGEGAAR